MRWLADLPVSAARAPARARTPRRWSKAYPAPWTYIATAQTFDDEMAERIALHQARRQAGWNTVDAPLDLVGALAGVPDDRPVLVDCLTLWLSNHMLAGNDVEAECRRLTDALSRPRGPWFVVSNEVGLGIVPDNALARRFRDAAGRLNQSIAAVADTRAVHGRRTANAGQMR